MAQLLYKPVCRRQFLKITASALGAAVVPALAGEAPVTADRWALVADTHIPANPDDSYRSFHPYRNLQTVVSRIRADLPDAVVIAGDLARLEGLPDDYVNLKQIMTPISSERPVLWALGNHDHRDNFSRAFETPAGRRQPVSGKLVTVYEGRFVRLVLLDSLFLVNVAAGLLGKVQRMWLERYLQDSDDVPTLLCFHHTMQDGDGDLLDVPYLFDIIRPVRKVKAILYGHSHEYKFSQRDGIHLINIPATGYNFNDAQPVGWLDSRLDAQGGTFTLHAIAGNISLDGQKTRLTWRT